MAWSKLPCTKGQMVNADWFTEIRAAINERTQALLDDTLNPTQGDGKDEMCDEDAFSAYRDAIDTLYSEFYEKAGAGPDDVTFTAPTKAQVMTAVFGGGITDWPDRDSMAKHEMFNDMRSVLNYLSPPFWVKAPETAKTDSVAPSDARQFVGTIPEWPATKASYFNWTFTHNDPGWTAPDFGYYTGEAGESRGLGGDRKQILLRNLRREPPRDNANVACEFYGQEVFVLDAGMLLHTLETPEDANHPTEGYPTILSYPPEMRLSVGGVDVHIETPNEGLDQENVWWEANRSAGLQTILNLKIYTPDIATDPGLPVPTDARTTDWYHLAWWDDATPYFQIRWDFRAP